MLCSDRAFYVAAVNTQSWPERSRQVKCAANKIGNLILLKFLIDLDSIHLKVHRTAASLLLALARMGCEHVMD